MLCRGRLRPQGLLLLVVLRGEEALLGIDTVWVKIESHQGRWCLVVHFYRFDRFNIYKVAYLYIDGRRSMGAQVWHALFAMAAIHLT